MLSQFGKEIRKIRIDLNVRLLDMANNLGVSSSYLSAVELGRRRLSDELFNRMADYLKIQQPERDELYGMALQQNKKISFDMDTFNINSKEVIALFARNLNKLSSQEIMEIKEILIKHDIKC